VKEFLFWRQWPASTRIFFWSFFALLLLGCTFIFVFQLQDPDSRIEYVTDHVVEHIPSSISNFSEGVFEFSIEANNNFVTRDLRVKGIKTLPHAENIYAVLLLLGITLLLAGISYAERILWFSVYMSFVVIGSYFLHWDILGIMGYHSKTPFIIITVLLIGVPFLFHAFFQKASFIIRFGSLALLVAAIAAFTLQYSTFENPVAHFVYYGYYVPTVITLLFIIISSVELITVFFFLSTLSRSANPKRNTYAFAGFILFYLINLLTLFLDRAGFIDWDLSFFNAFLLFALSLVAGVFIYPKRARKTFSFLFPHSWMPSVLYAGMGLISVSTLSFYFSNGNDAFIYAAESTIIYSYFAMGLLFFTYLMMNFGGAMINNLKAYRIIYEPQNLSFDLVRAFGLGLLFIMLLIEGYKSYDNWKAGSNIAIGDLYETTEKPLLAEYHYEQSIAKAPKNQKGNFKKALYSLEDGAPEEAKQFLANALEGQPKQYLYLKYAEIATFVRAWPNEPIDILRQGLETCDEKEHIKLSLSNLYAHSKGKVDSALHYIGDILDDKEVGSFAKGNLLFLLSSEKVPNKESLELLQDISFPEKDIFIEMNKVALKTVKNIALPVSYDTSLVGNTLNLFPLYYTENYSNLRPTEVPFVKKVKSLYKDSSNLFYQGELASIIARNAYFNMDHDKLKEYSDIAIALGQGGQKNDYLNTAALMAFHLGIEPLSKLYFEQASLNDYKLSAFNSVLAFGNPGNEAYFTEVLMGLTGYEDYSAVSWKFLAVIQQTDTDRIMTFTDREKVLFLYFNPRAKDEDFALKVLHSIEDKEMKMFGLQHLIKRSLNEKNTRLANTLWQQVPEKYPRTFEKGLNYQLLRLEFQNGAMELVESALKDLSFDSTRDNYLYAYRGEVAAMKGDTAEATTLLRKAIDNAPYDERSVASYAAYIRDVKNNYLESYQSTVDYLLLDPENVTVTKEYIFSCLSTGNFDYAEEGLKELQNKISAEEFTTYRKEYEKRKEIAEEQFNSWEQ
jgi:Tfp pilus assembly protein PilF